MIRQPASVFNENKEAVIPFIHHLMQLDKSLLLRTEIRDEFDRFRSGQPDGYSGDADIERLMRSSQLAGIRPPWVYISFRAGIAEWYYVRFNAEAVTIDVVPASEFLRFQETLVNSGSEEYDWNLEVDLSPFSRGFPRMKEKKSIGRGVEFLNRHLSTLLFAENSRGSQMLLDFLRVHKYRRQQLMLNNRIIDLAGLQEALREAEEYLNRKPADMLHSDVMPHLQELGFEAGWGRTVGRILENIELLIDILEAPDPMNLQKFLARIPMIFSMAIISPHGFFGQKNVLGLPDTGGQVVYILDQVKALENRMLTEVFNQGLNIEPEIIIVTRLIPEAGNTTCNEKCERVIDTQNVKIIRVPFRDGNGDIIPHWISRFSIWPHLERFSVEAEKEILAGLGAKPDLIIGNYSDGNLVATLLSNRLGVTQCNIAHALEKTKYLFSDLFWKDNEQQYHFSSQYTADFIAMNSADFIITSTYQEIAGTSEEVGQYESYASFTMPDLYRVVNGIDMFDPKFNIVSPGSDPAIYFPYTEKKRRFTDLHDDINELLFGENAPDTRGAIVEQNKPLLFALSRLDYIKNVSGFLEWYAQNDRIRRTANVFIIAGQVDPSKSNDDEERQQIDIMHSLYHEYGLDESVRWAGVKAAKPTIGEIYRYIADRRGLFVQPAYYEAFGLTVIEAMVSGLPTFATWYGGPREIIEHGRSGFHIDPNNGSEAVNLMADFLERSQADPSVWEIVSKEGINRVNGRYTWELYADRLLRLSRIYGFWKYVSGLEREETQRYLEMFYGLMYRRLAETV